jgi:ribose transport system substrate-binding protein
MKGQPFAAWRPRFLWTTLLVVVVVVVSACGSANGNTSTSAATGTSCGTVPTKAPDDPSGLLKTLPASYQAAYNGYSDPIYKSAWENWKPPKPPYTIGVSLTTLSDPFQVELANSLKADLLKIPGVKNVIMEISPEVVPTQIQQFDTLVERHVTMILYEPIAPAPFAAPVEAAGKAGIPSISIINSTPTPYSVNLDPNGYLDGADPAAAIARAIGGKGDVLEVHAIPGITIDTTTFDGFSAVLSRCPNMKVVGTVTGDYVDAQAKAETLQFLSTHPQPIAAVFQSAIMSVGVMSAFQQAGRTVPPVTDIGGELGSLAYWRGHESTYKGAGVGNGPVPEAAATARVAALMLSGSEPKISELVQAPPLITTANLSQWVPAGTSQSDENPSNGGANDYLPMSFLKPLFTGK